MKITITHENGQTWATHEVDRQTGLFLRDLLREPKYTYLTPDLDDPSALKAEEILGDLFRVADFTQQ